MRIVEFFTDPSSNALSMSRLGLGIIVCIVVAWTISCILGIPPANLVSPVSSMLGIVTGAIAGIYGANSFGGAWNRSAGPGIGWPPVPPENTGSQPRPRPRPRPRPKE